MAAHWLSKVNVPPNTLVISGTDFYGSNDPTNSIKALKEGPKDSHLMWSLCILYLALSTATQSADPAKHQVVLYTNSADGTTASPRRVRVPWLLRGGRWLQMLRQPSRCSSTPHHSPHRWNYVAYVPRSRRQTTTKKFVLGREWLTVLVPRAKRRH